MKIRTMFQIPRDILNELEKLTDNVGFELIWLDNSNQYIMIAKSIKNVNVYKGSVIVGDTITREILDEAIRNAVDKLVYVLEKAFTAPKQTSPKVLNVPFNERLRSHRNFLGLTLVEYAERVGSAPSTINRLETYPDYVDSVRDKNLISRIEKFIEGKLY